MVEVVEFFRTYWKRIGAVVISVAVALLLIDVFRPHERSINVTNLTWSRRISVDSWTTDDGSSWSRWSVPSNGRITRRSYEYHYSETVITGYVTNEDGSGTPIYASVPVYDYRYYYEYEDWRHARDVVTCGTYEVEPYWGDVNLSGPTGPYDTGKERESGRSEQFRVTDSDGTVYTASRELWDSLRVGDRRILTVHFGGWLEDNRE